MNYNEMQNTFRKTKMSPIIGGFIIYYLLPTGPIWFLLMIEWREDVLYWPLGWGAMYIFFFFPATIKAHYYWKKYLKIKKAEGV